VCSSFSLLKLRKGRGGEAGETSTRDPGARRGAAQSAKEVVLRKKKGDSGRGGKSRQREGVVFAVGGQVAKGPDT